MFNKIRRALLYTLYLLATVVLLLEVAYRWQWIDFYRTEWVGLNRPEDHDVKNNRRPLLLIGDSFSADQQGYVRVLRDSMPQWRILNGSVPGTGIRQAAIVAPGRIRVVNPHVFIYQIYIGNDLLDVEHRPNAGTISFSRRIYWWLSDRLLVLPWANYKLGALRTPVFADTKLVDTTFSIEKYSTREKLLLKAEPQLISQSASLMGARAADMEVLLSRLDDIRGKLPQNCRPVLMVIPHCAQVNAHYRSCMEALGAQFPDEAEWVTSRNRFVEKLRDHFANDPAVQILDALPLFESEDSPTQRLYYANDPHLNPLGQEILGKWLFENLTMIK